MRDLLAVILVIAIFGLLIVVLLDRNNQPSHKQTLVCAPMSRSTLPVYFSGINAKCEGDYCYIDLLNEDGSVWMHVSVDREDMICGVDDK